MKKKRHSSVFYSDIMSLEMLVKEDNGGDKGLDHSPPSPPPPFSLYPPPVPIPLDHASEFQLLVAVVLSAQSTDKKVNECTPALFAAAPSPEAMVQLDTSQIQEYIRQVGLAPTKAKNISKLSTMLVEQFGGKVPSTFEQLESLPGVGHKTASVVMAQAFGFPSFPVDTHIHRLAQRWGLSDGTNVERTEADLKALMPQDKWNDLHLQIIYFGREHCPAQKHDPQVCPICTWAAVPPFDRPGVSPLKAGQSLSSRPDLKSAKSAAKRKLAASLSDTSEKGAKIEETDTKAPVARKRVGRKKVD